MTDKGRHLAWGVAAAGCLIFTLAIAMRALGAVDAEFNRWVGWANIAGAVIAAVGLWLGTWGMRDHGQATPTEAADAMTEEVLTAEGHALRELLYAGRDPWNVADVTYKEKQIQHEFNVATGNLKGLATFYTDHTKGRLVILGPPGAGKTVMVLHLICQLARARQKIDEPQRTRTPVPIRLNLADWDTAKQDLRDWIAQQLAKQYTNVTFKTAKRLVKAGLVLPVLDGLDEMDAPGMTPGRARTAIEHLNRYMIGDHHLPMVVTCREKEYCDIGEQIAGSKLVTIDPLSDFQIKMYITQELGSPRDRSILEDWESLASTNGHVRLLDLLRTPWALTLAVVFLRDGGGARNLTCNPDELENDYRTRVWGLLVSRYLPARVRANREQWYTIDQVDRWTKAIAQNIGDKVNIEVTDFWDIHAPTRVWATYTLIVTICMLGSASVIIFTLNGWDINHAVQNATSIIREFPAVSIMRFVELAFYCLIAIVGILSAVWKAASLSVEPVLAPMSFAPLRTAKFWKYLIFMVIGSGFMMGLIAVPIAWLTPLIYNGPVLTLTDTITTGLIYGVAAGLWIGFTEGLSKDIDSVAPHSIVYTDLIAWLALGIGGCVLLGAVDRITDWPGYRIGEGFSLGFALGPAGGAAVGIGAGLATGVGQVWLLYMCGLINASMHRFLPLRINRFLGWAVRAGLLRRSGLVYQFRHLSLRNHPQDRPLIHTSGNNFG